MGSHRKQFFLASFRFFALACSLIPIGCAGPGYDSSSTVANGLLIRSAIDAVNVALSKNNCNEAHSKIYPLYNSANSNNSIRLAMASTYGCTAGVNVLSFVSDIQAFGGNLGGPALWEFLAAEFPSRSTDFVAQSAMAGSDAILASVDPIAVIMPANSVNANSNNPQSLLFTDRISDANAYLAFLSMAVVGSLENRYGLPTANNHKSQDLPWTSATLTQGDGCAFAAGLMNLQDGIRYVSSVASASVASKYSSISNFLNTALDAACSTGCTLCGGAVSCTTCPFRLRDRTSCTGLDTDVHSCAAAGITLFVNASWVGPP